MKLALNQKFIKAIIISTGATFIVGLSITNIYVANLHKEPTAIKASVNPVEEELAFWREIIINNPTYRDGYLHIAQLEKDRGNFQAAQEALKTAQEIDPNSEVKIIQ